MSRRVRPHYFDITDDLAADDNILLLEGMATATVTNFGGTDVTFDVYKTVKELDGTEVDSHLEDIESITITAGKTKQLDMKAFTATKLKLKATSAGTWPALAEMAE